MKISIVTISMNQARFLERALRSVIKQDHPEVEYIVVDPGSLDGSRKIIESHGGRIAKIILDPDNGPADGLNKGFGHATGDIYGYINADDGYIPGALAKVARAFEENPDIDVLLGHGFFVNEAGTVTRRFRASPYNLRRCAYGAAPALQQSTFFRRSAFLRAGGFNAENRTCWDGELLVRMALMGSKFKVLDEYLSIFTIHSGSITGTGRLIPLYREDQRRLFQTIVGRKPSGIDGLLRRLARLEKWLCGPKAALVPLLDTVFGPPRIRCL